MQSSVSEYKQELFREIQGLSDEKIKGREGIWEARIDLHYRLTFEIIGETIFLRVAGNHDDVIKNP